MDTAMSLTAGHVFAIAASEHIEKGDREQEQVCAWRARIFAALVTVPMGLYFLVRWPDWSWMYFNRKHPNSKLLGALGLAGYIGASELGYRNAVRLIRSNRKWAALLSAAASVLLTVMIGILGLGRLSRIGTCEQFEQGKARSILFKPSFHASMITAGAIAVPVGIHFAVRNASVGPKL
jgi:hypothetical protein